MDNKWILMNFSHIYEEETVMSVPKGRRKSERGYRICPSGGFILLIQETIITLPVSGWKRFRSRFACWYWIIIRICSPAPLKD